ncbi:hypothetical protein GC387_08955 [Pseudomonas sp. MWU12-2323]|nr:hypothetical protein [Pseudomonas sp. MWU12-2323]
MKSRTCTDWHPGPRRPGCHCLNTVLVGAGLAREGAFEAAKSFAGKPCSYRFGGVPGRWACPGGCYQPR